MERKTTAYRYRTYQGYLWLACFSDDRWHVMTLDDDLGSFATAEEAARAISLGLVHRPGMPDHLYVSGDLRDWVRTELLTP